VDNWWSGLQTIIVSNSFTRLQKVALFLKKSIFHIYVSKKNYLCLKLI